MPRPLARALSALLALAVALTPLALPAPALARKAASDAVAGIRVGDGKLPVAAAPDVDAAAGILVTADGRVLWARNAEARRPMASTTKMMTGLLAVERGGLDRVVTVSRAAAGVPYASGLTPGQRLTVRQLLELALVASSNDAAYALGESVSGSMPAFVARMNARARELGLRDTSFANPHGLDQPRHYSSAADLAVLARKAMSLPDFRRTVSMRRVALPGGPWLAPTDELLGRYAGLDGVKTGFTEGAGYSFVGSAQRGDVRLFAVVLGTPSNPGRFTQAAGLLDWGFRNLVRRTLASEGETAGVVPISADRARKVTARVGKGVSLSVLAAAGPVEREVSLSREVTLPVFAGQPLGEVRFRQAGRLLATAPVVAAEATASVGETLGAVPVSDYLDRTVTVRAGEARSVPAFDPAKPVRRRIELLPNITAPVAPGQRLGEVVYTQGPRVVLRVPAVAAHAAEVPAPLDRLGIALVRGWRAVFGGGPPTAALQVDGG